MNEVTRESAREAAAPAVAQEKFRRVLQVPRVDIREGSDAYRVVADLPGVGPDGVEATVERNVLTIVGRVEREAPEGYRHVYGAPAPTEYRRAFTLSDRIDTTRIEASMKNGTLVLTLPKAVEVQPRRIAVAA